MQNPFLLMFSYFFYKEKEKDCASVGVIILLDHGVVSTVSECSASLGQYIKTRQNNAKITLQNTFVFQADDCVRLVTWPTHMADYMLDPDQS